MSVFGVSMVRDEADVIRPVIEHMLTQVDGVIVADNLSTDGTRDILDSLPVTVVDDPEPGYFQSRKMTALAHRAAVMGAEWVVPFDADEIWYSPFGRLGDMLNDIAPQWLCAAARLYDHVSTGADPDDADPIRRIRWRRPEPGPLPKVAVRTRPDLVIEQGNHKATYHGGATILQRQFVIRHFPYRSVEQFVSKVRNGVAAYNATDLPEDTGTHWRGYGRILAERGEEGLAEVFHKWFYRADPKVPIEVDGETQPPLVLDPAMASVPA